VVVVVFVVVVVDDEVREGRERANVLQLPGHSVN